MNENPRDETEDGWPLGYVDDRISDGVTNDEEYVPCHPEEDEQPEPQTEDEWISENIY